MLFVLSSESTEALSSIPDIEGWLVQPTMKRGSAKAAGVAPPGSKGGAGKKPAEKPLVKGTIAKLAGKISKSKHKVNVDEDDVVFRRSKEGRDLVRQKLEKLRRADWEAFPKNPVFDSDGNMRMKHPAAKLAPFDRVLELGPLCIEHMQLVSLCVILFGRLKKNRSLFQPRYKTLRSLAAYDAEVRKLFQTIESQLSRKDNPTRQGWLRLIHEISNFICSQTPAAAAEE